MLIFGGIISSTNSNLLDVGGAAFMVEGAGDLISGDHHYIMARALKCLSRGKIDITGEYGNKYGTENKK